MVLYYIIECASADHFCDGKIIACKCVAISICRNLSATIFIVVHISYIVIIIILSMVESYGNFEMPTNVYRLTGKIILFPNSIWHYRVWRVTCSLVGNYIHARAHTFRDSDTLNHPLIRSLLSIYRRIFLKQQKLSNYLFSTPGAYYSRLPQT